MKNDAEVKRIVGAPLRELGCSDAEIEVYAQSLARGPASIASLASSLGMARPNVYKVIQQLEKKGLARLSEKKRYARNFQVVSPAVVLERLRERQRRMDDDVHLLSRAMPDIVSLYKQVDLPAKVEVVTGREQFLRIFWNILEEGQPPLRFCGSIKDFLGFISWNEERKWIAERMRRGHSIQALLFKDPDSETMRAKDAQEMRETRFLTSVAPFKTSFQLFGNKAVFWQPATPAAILVEDELVVDMLKSIFDRLWHESSAHEDNSRP